MKIIAGVLLVGMAMIGLYFKVESSGWVLFAGCLVAVSS